MLKPKVLRWQLPLLPALCLAFLCLEARGETAALTTSQFMNTLAACATNLRINIDANIVGSITSTYEGESTKGRLAFQAASEFLSLFPAADRLRAYDLYRICVTSALASSGHSSENRRDERLSKLGAALEKAGLARLAIGSRFTDKSKAGRIQSADESFFSGKYIVYEYTIAPLSMKRIRVYVDDVGGSIAGLRFGSDGFKGRSDVAEIKGKFENILSEVGEVPVYYTEKKIEEKKRCAWAPAQTGYLRTYSVIHDIEGSIPVQLSGVSLRYIMHEKREMGYTDLRSTPCANHPILVLRPDMLPQSEFDTAFWIYKNEANTR